MPDIPSSPASGVPSASSGSPSTPSPAVSPTLWRPVLLRAAVALVFGAVTVFWGQPTTAGAAWALGAYFMGLAAAQAWQLREEGRRQSSARPSKAQRTTASAAFGFAAAVGIALGAAPQPAVLAVGGAIALGLTGASDLFRGIAGRSRSPLARDAVIAGVVHLGAAVLLPFFTGLGAHALLGVSGGAAIITGVLLAVAGLSLRHDSQPRADVA
ncbi:hypothetical protein [Sinomonas mesophila]|uniref:hypothetical protein n=1 Tax=Sinomonas mesophila TaxID=1531955 RepID=UPI001FEC4F6E|nr:hypothetical protein [Sinomonas mesophila]